MRFKQLKALSDTFYFIQKVVDASAQLPLTPESEALVAVLFRCVWKAIENETIDVAALSKSIFGTIAKQINGRQYNAIHDFLLSECKRESQRQSTIQLYNECAIAGVGVSGRANARGLAALQLLSIIQVTPAAHAAGSARKRFVSLMQAVGKFAVPFHPTQEQLEMAAALLSAVHAGLTSAVTAGSTLGPREMSTVLQFVGSVVDLKGAAQLLSGGQPQSAATAQYQCNLSQFVAVLRSYYRILESLLRCYKPAVLSCISAYLTVLRTMMTSFLLMDQTSAAGHDVEITEMSQNVSRVLGNISTFPGAGKHAPYIIADYIASQKFKVLSPRAKQGLQPGMFLLYDACSVHDIAMLHAGLDSSGKTLLSRLKEERDRSQRYTGES